MKRREFMTMLTGATVGVWCKAYAQAMPKVGVLLSGSRASSAPFLQAFHSGLLELGYVEARNAAVEYRWAGDHHEAFRALAADLTQAGVHVIVAVSSPAVAAAKAATSSIPIVFYVGVDPVQFGFVHSLAHPNGNLTGATNFSLEIGPKRLQLMAELLGARRRVAALLNPRSAATAGVAESLRSAAQALGLYLHLAYAGGEEEFAPRFAEVVQLGAAGLMISGDPFFNSQAERLGALSLKYGLPTIFQTGEFTAAGGLVSYGTNFQEQYRLVGVYTGRILKGDKAADLPVQQPTRFDLIINLKSAKALGVEVPPLLVARADEVIE